MKVIFDLSLFRRNRNFSLLYFGQFISFLGTMMTGVALPYQIYHETHSTLWVGLLSLAQLLPILVTALLGGVIADRYARRRLLLMTETLLSLGSIMLAWNAHLGTPSLALLFIVAAAMSACGGLHTPALESMLQQVVVKTDFPTVSSLRMLKGSIGMIGGPAIGGLIIAHFGLVTIFLVDFVSFLLSLIALCLIENMPKPATVPGESTWHALRAGVRYAFSRQELIGTYVVDFIAMIFGMPNALMPAIAASFGGVKTLGFLYAAPAVGATIVSCFSGWTLRIRRHGVAIALAAAGWGIAIIGFGFSPYLDLALFFLVIAGAMDGISGIFRVTLWSQTIPQHYRGRLAGIEMISYLSGPKLGDTEAGLVAAAFGVTFSVVSGGVICVLGVLLACFALPKFWHYEAPIEKE